MDHRRSIEVRDIEKYYKRRKVLHGVSFRLKQGEIVGLLGPNGSGKTSSFYIVMGLLPLDGGGVFLDEQDINALPPHERARQGISYLPQESSIFKKLSVEENIESVLEIKIKSAKERKTRLQGLLADFHLEHIAKSPGIALSGGERRRTEIARALASDPDFILLDEPFAGVDPLSIDETKKLITTLAQRGLGVLITDHNVRELLDVCSRTYVLVSGHVIAEGSKEEITRDPQVRKLYLGEQF